MPSNENNNKSIYLKSTRQWVPVSDELYDEYRREIDAYIHKMRSHKCCRCPKSKWWLCDKDCWTCAFHCSDEFTSLDAPINDNMYRRVPLSHPGSGDAAACGERFYVSLRTVVWGKKKPAQTLRKIDCLSECSYRLNSLGSARAERGGYGSVSLAWGHCLMGSFYGIYCVYKHT